jgi:hypothetical protein
MNWVPVDATGHPSPLRQSSITSVSFSPQHESVYFSNGLVFGLIFTNVQGRHCALRLWEETIILLLSRT